MQTDRILTASGTGNQTCAVCSMVEPGLELVSHSDVWLFCATDIEAGTSACSR